MGDLFWSGLLPKSETQALKFVVENPSWDGRGVVVGILDTGVDPGAIGLTTTSDGKPKVIDIIDCSGSGDVAMGAPVKAESILIDGITKSSGCLQGLSGRVLKLNSSWANPTGMFRLGLKRAYEIYPRGLAARVKEERMKSWNETHKSVEAALQKDLVASQASAKPVVSGESNDVEEIKTRVAQLRQIEKDLEDPGPLYDCLVFHDGERWQAVVDTSEVGDMSNTLPMTDYRVSQQYAAFSEIDALNYCVNIFDEGSTLSIVVDAGAHGSHVSGITAAYHPEQLELNGVAPGAQIISLKIGDSRLGSMETGVGLIRALTEAVKRGCHVINMSYGEATSWDNYGEYVKQAEVMVRKHGIIFVSSAGNNGPAISTVGCPGGTSSCCIGVAAMVTQSLMTAAYSMQETVPETNFTWSSVGPTLDGDLGVSIMAPGGAVTSVPNWTRSRNQLMNGTSMSSPNATGCIALLLSACKANNIKVSPASMKRIVENSAKLIDGVDRLGQGHGLIQVKEAWDLILKSKEQKWADVEFAIKVESQRFSRGIYLRQPLESNTANTYKVAVEPVFHDDVTSMQRTDFELRIKLECNVPWIKCAEHLLMVQGGKTLSVFIDCRALPPGVHVAFIKGYDEAFPDLGPQFQIPVTVVRSETIRDQTSTWHLEMDTAQSPTPQSGIADKREISFLPGERIRRFIVPPKGCTFIDAVIVDRRAEHEQLIAGEAPPDIDGQGQSGDDALSMSGATDGTARMICLHALQTFRGTSYSTHEKQTYMNLTPGSQHVVSWAVTEGVTMELVMARVWSTLESPRITVTLHFRGVTPSPSRLLLTGGQRVSDIIRISNTLAAGLVEISPTSKLDKWISVVKPIAVGKVTPLGERDVLFTGTTLYQLVLEYEIEQAEAGELTPRWPGLQGSLYESQFSCQFFMVYDGKKKLLGSGDCFPSAIKTQKGKHTVRIQIKHASISVLESINDMSMQLQRPLKAPIPLTFFLTHSDTLVGTAKMGPRGIAPGGSVSFYCREPNADQVPKGVMPGDTLMGTITYIKKDNSALGCGTKPGGYEVKYVVGDTKIQIPVPAVTPAATSSSPLTIPASAEDSMTPALAPSSSDSATATATVTPAVTAPGKEKESGIDAAVREAKTKYLKSQVGTQAVFDPLYLTVEAEYPSDLPLKLVGLSHAVKCKSNALAAYKKTPSAETKDVALTSFAAVVISSESVVALIDQDSVARELGTNTDKDDAAAVAARKEADTKKAALIEAYSAAASAILDKVKLLTSLCEVTAVQATPVSAPAVPTGSLSVTETVPASEVVATTPIDVVTVPAPATVTASEYGAMRDAARLEFESSCKSLQRWDDLNADKHWLLCVGRLKLKNHWGLALKKIQDLSAASADNKPKGDLVPREVLYEERLMILEQLQWSHALKDAKAWALISSKETYDLF